MVSTTQLTVPNLRTPTVTLFAASAGAPTVNAAMVDITRANRTRRNGRSFRVVFCSVQSAGVRHEMSGQLRCHRKRQTPFARVCEARNLVWLVTARGARAYSP